MNKPPLTHPPRPSFSPLTRSSRHTPLSQNDTAARGETSLWKAVITQALMDAGSNSAKQEAQHERAKAIRWLLGNSDDFNTVCLNANLDPVCVREKARLAIGRGCTWRNTELPMPAREVKSRFAPVRFKPYRPHPSLPHLPAAKSPPIHLPPPYLSKISTMTSQTRH